MRPFGFDWSASAAWSNTPTGPDSRCRGPHRASLGFPREGPPPSADLRPERSRGSLSSKLAPQSIGLFVERLLEVVQVFQIEAPTQQGRKLEPDEDFARALALCDQVEIRTRADQNSARTPVYGQDIAN